MDFERLLVLIPANERASDPRRTRLRVALDVLRPGRVCRVRRGDGSRFVSRVVRLATRSARVDDNDDALSASCVRWTQLGASRQSTKTASRRAWPMRVPAAFDARLRQSFGARPSTYGADARRARGTPRRATPCALCWLTNSTPLTPTTPAVTRDERGGTLLLVFGLAWRKHRVAADDDDAWHVSALTRAQQCVGWIARR